MKMFLHLPVMLYSERCSPPGGVTAMIPDGGPHPAPFFALTDISKGVKASRSSSVMFRSLVVTTTVSPRSPHCLRLTGVYAISYSVIMPFFSSGSGGSHDRLSACGMSGICNPRTAATPPGAGEGK